MGDIYVFHAHESAPFFKALRQAGGPDAALWAGFHGLRVYS